MTPISPVFRTVDTERKARHSLRGDQWNTQTIRTVCTCSFVSVSMPFSTLLCVLPSPRFSNLCPHGNIAQHTAAHVLVISKETKPEACLGLV
ncbi:hypothetical protein B0T09DRAFT_341938 [Sordaria sp. MPI-SDFR-AT-0083]|nr:hypothetical protein B0T09DRAFT_341938 [Sordaria sp. MPI-SDFR-AT-0083]